MVILFSLQMKNLSVTFSEWIKLNGDCTHCEELYQRTPGKEMHDKVHGKAE